MKPLDNPRLRFGFALLGFAAVLSLAQAADDVRQPVPMPAMMQEHMRANMRDHLQTLNAILAALAAGRYDEAATQAEKRLGMDSLVAHGAEHMAPMMPPAMREIGTAMHHAASRLAVAAQDASVSGDLPRVLGALAEVTQQCVACHARFRLGEAP